VEIEISDPAGRKIPHNVTALSPCSAIVTFRATECGLHHACITFNGEKIPGNSFVIFTRHIIENNSTGNYVFTVVFLHFNQRKALVGQRKLKVSGQSSSIKPSYSKTEVKHCTTTEIR